MSYRYIEDIAPADAAFEAKGPTLGELFVSAADAVVNIMVENPESIQFQERRRVSLTEDDPEILIFLFLNEIVFYKDAENLILRADNVSISEAGEKYELDATLAGEIIDQDKHKMIVDVKAVTLHRLKITKEQEGWSAVVVVDL